MRKIFTAKINIWVALLLTAVISLTLSLGIFRAYASFGSTHFSDASESSTTSAAEGDGDDYTPVYEAAAYIDRYFVGDTEGYSPVESAVEGMVDGLGDRWSYYVSPDEMDAYYENLNNSYVGIGVTVTKNDEGYCSIEKVSPGSGAEAAGLEPGDVITCVAGEDISALALTDISSAIRGDEGTFINLTILKSDGSTITVDVERKTVATEIVTGEMIGKVGYIALDNFNIGSADAFIAMAKDFIAQGAEAFVFDMRFNGGGRLTELIEILDYLLPEGQLFRMVDKNGQEVKYSSDASCVDLPMTVLINDCTYSAAEYFAAALRQYGKATIVGTQTVGKGFAQNTFTLSDGSAIAISVYRYYTPNGDCLAGVGLTPDYVLEISDEEYIYLYYDRLDTDDDRQLQLALSVVSKQYEGNIDLRKANSFWRWFAVNEENIINYNSAFKFSSYSPSQIAEEISGIFSYGTSAQFTVRTELSDEGNKLIISCTDARFKEDGEYLLSIIPASLADNWTIIIE